MPDQVMMHQQRAMPELRALHQRLRLRNLPSTRKVTIFHHMRITASPFPPGETSIHAVYRCIRYSPRRAAPPAGSADEDRAQPTDGLEQAPAQVGLPELRRRARMMFSGDTGGVVASGGTAATSTATSGLLEDVIKVVGELPRALFDPTAEHRPCGLLCKRGACGMLICDVLRLPLVPWELAEPVGKEAVRLADKIPVAKKKEKKAAGRRGYDPEMAAAEVLRRTEKLPVPTAAEITAAKRRLARAAQLTAQPPVKTPPPFDFSFTVPTAAPSPFASSATAPAPAPASAPPPAPAPEPEPTPAPVPRQLREGDELASRELTEELMECEYVGRAIVAAVELERHIPAPIDIEAPSDSESDESDTDADEQAELATIKYKYALRRLDKRYPDIQFHRGADRRRDTAEVATEVNSMPCFCGKGRMGRVPWHLQLATHGYCKICLKGVWLRRCDWVSTSLGLDLRDAPNQV